MKARIRKTNEIVEIISHNCLELDRDEEYDSVSYIDSKGQEHHGENLNVYWDFEPIEITPDEHWQDVRERAAIAAMQGLSTNPNLVCDVYVDGGEKIDIVARAMRYADELVGQLKRK